MTKLLPTHSRSVADVTQGIASLVWWQFSGTKIRPIDLRDALTTAGFDSRTVPDIDPVQGLRSAVRDFSVRDGRRKVREAVVVSSDPSKVCINILEYRVQSERKSHKVCVDVLVWDRVTNDWQEQGTTEDADNLRLAVYNRQMFYDGNAVRQYLIEPALAESNAFTLRRGVYVVPHLTNGPLARVQYAVETCRDLEGFTLSVAQVAGDEQTRATMGHMAQESVRDELAELQEQIDGWREMASRVRSDTREKVLARFQELRQKAELYSQAMQVTLEDLTDEIRDLEDVAIDLIQVKDDEADANQPAPAKSAGDARRDALRGMTSDQRGILWSVHCDGEFPSDEDQQVEGIASALEAA